ncbi:MAG: hypothetical protein QMD92_05870 [bacterium]|nr:hypothetical protein [bacterium]
MSLEESWERAVRETEVVRYRISSLQIFKTTEIPYIMLSESQVNVGDTVVRKGNVLVHEPLIILPKNYPIFEGFDFESNYHIDKSILGSFFLLRGITFPSLKYHHKTSNLDVFEGSLEKAVSDFKNQLERNEDVKTGLIVGPSEGWQFSVLIFVCSIVARSANKDVAKLLEDLKKRNR